VEGEGRRVSRAREARQGGLHQLSGPGAPGQGDWNRQALEGFVRELLPAMDGFSMAKFEDPKLLEAVRILEKEFLRVLAKTGVTPIETAGKAFDPLYHDAVAMEQGGTQLEEVRRGWLFDGKVLRAASVRLVKPKDGNPVTGNPGGIPPQLQVPGYRVGVDWNPAFRYKGSLYLMNLEISWLKRPRPWT
jgi:hypothetical protein